MIAGMPRNTSVYDDRERAQRQERPAGEQPNDCDDQRPDQHDDLGDDEELDVPPEARESARCGSPDETS